MPNSNMTDLGLATYDFFVDKIRQKSWLLPTITDSLVCCSQTLQFIQSSPKPKGNK
jgi:hypothetical protein